MLRCSCECISHFINLITQVRRESVSTGFSISAGVGPRWRKSYRLACLYADEEFVYRIYHQVIATEPGSIFALRSRAVSTKQLNTILCRTAMTSPIDEPHRLQCRILIRRKALDQIRLNARGLGTSLGAESNLETKNVYCSISYCTVPIAC